MLVLLLACAVPDPTDHDSLESLLEAWADEGFDGTVWVERQGEVELSVAHGECNRDTGAACTVDTVYDIGSLTKQFTGAGISALEEDGLLQRTQTLGEFFTDVPADKASITLEMLLTHTSGFTEQLGDDDETLSKRDFLQGAWRKPLESVPGEQFTYANIGYSLLSAVIEEVSGEGYEAYLRRRLWEPAGMEATGYVLPDWSAHPVALGYGSGELGSPLEQNWTEAGPPWNLLGNGGILSTAEDMAIWHRALRDATVLTPQTVAAMQQGRVRECEDCDGTYDGVYASGWTHVPETGLRWHDGTNDHFFTVMLRWLDEDLLVYTATNDWKRREEELTWQVARWVEPAR